MLITNKDELLPRELQLSFGKIVAIVDGQEGRGRRRLVIPIDPAVAEGAKKEDGGYIPLDGKKLSIGTTTTGRPKVIRGNVGKFALLSSHGGYTRRGNGYNKLISGEATTLASGNGADGDAGRIGTWGVDLFRLDSPEGIIVCNVSGGCDPEFLIWDRDNAIVIPEKEILDFYESKGADVPDCLKVKERDIKYLDISI